jgi:hypothetical protein
MCERSAERPHFAFGFICRFQEGLPFGRRQVFAVRGGRKGWSCCRFHQLSAIDKFNERD